MYGVPSDLDLDSFKGATLIQVCLGEFQLQFKFDSDAEISVEGAWQIVGRNSEIVDAGTRNVQRTENRVHLLLGRKVEGWSVHAPEWFELQFEGRLALRVFDDSEQYESFSIQPGDIFV